LTTSVLPQHGRGRFIGDAGADGVIVLGDDEDSTPPTTTAASTLLAAIV
jgi:hypothetical protein